MKNHKYEGSSSFSIRPDLNAGETYYFLNMVATNLEELPLDDCIFELAKESEVLSGNNVIHARMLVPAHDVLKMFKITKFIQFQTFAEYGGTQTLSFGTDDSTQLESQSFLGAEYFSLPDVILFSKNYCEQKSEDEFLNFNVSI
jgi:hypothetical protein